MSDGHGKLTSIAWREVFPWINLAAALRVAVGPRALALATLALLGTTAGWRICGRVCTELFVESAAAPGADTSVSMRIGKTQGIERFEQMVDYFSQWPWEQMPPFGGQAALPSVAAPAEWWFDNPMTRARAYLSAPLVNLFNAEASWPEFVFLLLCALWELVVWAFFGGAITRLAAVALAREEQLSWGQLTGYARSKWSSYFTAPLFPLFGVLLATVPLALFGLLLRADLGVLVAGALWFLVLGGGFFMAVLLVGMFFGWPLMWATISAEGTDSFDALSRSYAYTYQRPLHYFFYTVVAALLGVLGWFVVMLFASSTIRLGAWGVSWLDGNGSAANTISQATWLPTRSTLGSSAETGLMLVRFWLDLVVTIGLAYAFSYFWTATTAIYFLLRQQVDNTELDEVYVPEEDHLHGLPPLVHDAAGVPGVADVGVVGDNPALG